MENFNYTINGAVDTAENDEVFRVIGTSVGETIYADNRTFQSSLSINGKGGDDFIEIRDGTTLETLTVRGGTGRDQLIVSDDNPSLQADKALLLGGKGGDLLRGGTYLSERLKGGAGNDHLSFYGMHDNSDGDVLVGGRGADVFVFLGNTGNRKILEDGQVNRITDFSSNDFIGLNSFLGITADDFSSGAVPNGDGNGDANFGLIYDQNTGILSYRAVKIAALGAGTELREDQLIFDYETPDFFAL